LLKLALNTHNPYPHPRHHYATFIMLLIDLQYFHTVPYDRTV
jgi:hypothetical protein